MESLFKIVIYHVLVILLSFSPSHSHTHCIAAVTLLAHIFKDILLPSNFTWLLWTEVVALGFGATIVVDRVPTWQKIIGVCIIVGHVRQLIFRDDKYYTI